MDSFFRKAQEALQQVTESQGNRSGSPAQGGGKELRLPTPVLEWIDKYVDTFAPSISKQVSDEIVVFQNATLQSLEDHIKSVFQAVFRGDFSAFQPANNIADFRAAREDPRQVTQDPTAIQRQQQFGAGVPTFNYPTPQTRSGAVPLPEYGSRGLPFAGQAVNILGTQMSIFNNQNGESAPQHERNIFQSAVNKVTEFAKSADDGIGGKLAAVAHTIDELNIDPLEKAKQVTPELREKVAKVLTDLHAPLSDKLTILALTQVKKFLKGSISLSELGEGAMESIGGLLRGFSKPDNNSSGATRGVGDGGNPVPEAPGGFVGLLSEKLSDGLTIIRAHTREDFRKVLGEIEEALFNSLPSEISGPLMKVLGGNPFSDDQQQQQQRSGGGGGFNIFDDIKDKLKTIIERIQKGLRDRVLEVVSGGHRKLEDKAWGNVQDAVVTKVRQFVPGIQVKLDD